MSFSHSAFSPLIARIEAGTVSYDDYADALELAAHMVGLEASSRDELMAEIKRRYPTHADLMTYLRTALEEWRNAGPGALH